MPNKAKTNESMIFAVMGNIRRSKHQNKELLESYARAAVNQVFKKKGGFGVPLQPLIHLIVSRYKIDIIELIDYTKLTLKEMPDISHKNLCILLLIKVANHTKNKKMGRIAKGMLRENWWTKKGEKKSVDIFNRIMEVIRKQKTKDLLKESLFEMVEMIIDSYRRPSDEKNRNATSKNPKVVPN